MVSDKFDFSLTFEQTLAAIKEEGDDVQKSFARFVSSFVCMDDETIDLAKVYSRLRHAHFPVKTDGGLYRFVAFELLHLKTGPEFMRKLLTQPILTMFYDFCNLTDATEETEYFLKLGLDRELYFSKHPLTAPPLHTICGEVCVDNASLKKLIDVPKYIIEEGFFRQDDVGNTMLHLSPSYYVNTNITFYVLLKYLSTFEGYEKALLLTNNKGNTPLHHIINECNCIKTIQFLLATPSGKLAAGQRNNAGETPYQLMNEAKIHYEHYDTGDNVDQRLNAVLDELKEFITV